MTDDTSLIRTREYIDLPELSQFVHKNYGYPAPGSMNSFHSQFSEAMGYPGQNEMVHLEMMDDEGLQDYDEAYGKMVRLFRKMVEDGHLPERDEYSVEVWW